MNNSLFGLPPKKPKISYSAIFRSKARDLRSILEKKHKIIIEWNGATEVKWAHCLEKLFNELNKDWKRFDGILAILKSNLPNLPTLKHPKLLLEVYLWMENVWEKDKKKEEVIS